MGWSGGTYTKGNNATGGWAGDASLGIGIEAGRHDTQDDDFTAGINNCIAKDGQNTPTQNLPMGGYKHTGVADATAGNQYVSYRQLLDVSKAVTSTGTEPAYEVTLTPTPSAYFTGMTFDFLCHALMSSDSGGTLNVNSLGAKDIYIEYSSSGGTTRRRPAKGELCTGQAYRVTYNGTEFILHNPTFSSTQIDLTPTWSSASGTISLVANTDTNYRYISASTIKFTSYCTLSLTGASSQYIAIQLPFTADDEEDQTICPAMLRNIGGSSLVGMIGIFGAGGTELRIFNTDYSLIPTDTNFLANIDVIYNIGS
jgi:hypothetical protein